MQTFPDILSDTLCLAPQAAGKPFLRALEKKSHRRSFLYTRSLYKLLPLLFQLGHLQNRYFFLLLLSAPVHLLKSSLLFPFPYRDGNS